jgi:hypothetical protein
MEHGERRIERGQHGLDGFSRMIREKTRAQRRDSSDRFIGTYAVRSERRKFIGPLHRTSALRCSHDSIGRDGYLGV